MQYIKYLDNQVMVPDYLLDLCRNQTKISPDLFVKKGNLTNLDYYSYAAPEQLIMWVKCHYNFTKTEPSDNFRIQIIKHKIPIHKDKKRLFALNFIIEPGNKNVSTSYYDINNNLLYSEYIKPKVWHILDTQTRHGVNNLKENDIRMSISIDLTNLPLDVI